MPITLTIPEVIKLADLNPLLRNTNVAGPTEDKAGPMALARLADGTFLMYYEGVENDGAALFNYPTQPLRATSSTLQGFWATSPESWVLTATTAEWEYKEISPSSLWWDAPNNRWVMWYHGGNNNGSVTRRIGVAYSTDGIQGFTWTRDGGNPILTPGTTGATDDQRVADLKIQRLTPAQAALAGYDFLGFYRGVKAGSGNDGTLHRVGGNSPNSLTKLGEVLGVSGAPTWRASGITPGAWWVDSDNRIHMILSAPTYTDGGGFAGSYAGQGALGYLYSDDWGATWTEGAANPLWVYNDDSTSGYEYIIGDVVQGIRDADVLFITTGVDAPFSPYPNFPMRGQAAAIVPAVAPNPVVPARFFHRRTSGGTAPYTAVTGTTILSSNTFTVLGRFRAFRTQRSAGVRTIYTESDGVFNIEHFIRLNTSGQIEAFVRTPTNFTATFASARAFDDGKWHDFMLVRVAAGLFQLWIDGVCVGSDGTNIGTTATAQYKAVGNWHQSAGVANEPLNGTVSKLVTVVGTALTWAQALDVIRTNTYPGGVSPTVNFPTSGTDAGDVYVVDAFQPTLAQAAYRFRADDGSEASASYLAAQNTNASRALATPTRLRVRVQADGDPAGTRFELEYRRQGETQYRRLKKDTDL